MRSIRYPLVAVVCGVLVIAGVRASATDDKDASESTAPEPSTLTPSSTTAPAPVETFAVGPLEITPAPAFLRLYLDSYNKNVQLSPTIRFKVRNTSAGDVKLILMRNALEATDDFGFNLLHNGQSAFSAPLNLSDLFPQDWGQVFEKDRSKFITLSPKQVLQVQVTRQSPQMVTDGISDFFTRHRPKTLSFSASLAVVDVSGATEVRPISFDVPLTVTAGR